MAWPYSVPSFKMDIFENSGVEIQTPTGEIIGRFSGDEVGRLRDALNWAMEEITKRKAPQQVVKTESLPDKPIRWEWWNEK